MSPQLIVIKTPEEVRELGRYLADKEYVAFDTETTGLTAQDQIIGYSICAEEDRAYYVIIKAWDGTKLVCETDEPYTHFDMMHILSKKKLIMHNSTFDCMMVDSNFKVNLMPSVHTDTMILAHLLDENRRVGLKELGKSMYGESADLEAKEMKESIIKRGGKITKTEYELYKADSMLIGKYGAKDALLTFKLFLDLVPELYEQGLDSFFYDDESMPLLRGPTYHLNTTGMSVDQQTLTALKKTLQAECEEDKSFIYSEINSHIIEKFPGTNKKNVFKLSSNQQMSWLLFGKLELEFNTLTDTGREVCKSMGLKLPYTKGFKNLFISTCLERVGMIYRPEGTVNGKKVRAKKIKEPWHYISVDQDCLSKLAPKHKWIERLLSYQKKMKILSTYIKGIEQRTRYGVIRPSFLQHGTTSGRYSSRDPNFQNLPRDDKRVKGCIRSREGRSFVGADYSQLEPRVFAYFSGDKRLLEAFKGQDDFYSVIGIEVYDKFDATPRKEGSPDAFGVKYKKLRDLSKVIALASTYGATARQLAPTTGKSVDDTQEDIDSYFEKFPDVKNMMLESHRLAKTQGYVTNLFGRPRRMPDAMKIDKLYGSLDHDRLPYEARNMLNLAVNHRIQSTGASIINRAAIRFFDNIHKLGLDCQIVLQVHDSLVVECPDQDAETISLLLQDAMENTVQLEGIRLEAIPKIGKTLADV